MSLGSKPGERRGGRQKGIPNKAMTERLMRAEAGLAAARETGVMPLDVMLARMRDEPLPNGRKPTVEQFQAAVAAAPYVHPRLSAVTVRDMTPLDPRKAQEEAEARAYVVGELKEFALLRQRGIQFDAPAQDRQNAVTQRMGFALPGDPTLQRRN